MRAVVDPGPTRLDEFTGRDHRGVAKDGDQVTLAAGFDAQHAKAVLGVVEGHPVDEPGQASVGVLALGTCGIRV